MRQSIKDFGLTSIQPSLVYEFSIHVEIEFVVFCCYQVFQFLAEHNEVAIGGVSVAYDHPYHMMRPAWVHYC